MSPRATMWMLVILLIAALVGTCTLIIRPAHTHEAPSGWSYPSDCCSNQDCRPVPCDAVKENPKGFVWDGILFELEKVKDSGDKQCHACFTARYGRCLFLKKKEIF
jgi:hypothetical protein